MYIQQNNTNTKNNMPKLQNLNHAPNLAKMENNVRNTHLRLDPIDNQSPANFNENMTRNGPVAASMQFQKGMLSPLDSNNQMGSSGKYLPTSSNVPSGMSPSNNKHKKAQQLLNSQQQMNQSNYRRQHEQLSPLAAYEIEREQTQQRIFSTYIRPNQGGHGTSAVNSSSHPPAKPAQN